MEELKRYLLYKIKEFETNPYYELTKDYSIGCIDMCTEIINKIEEMQDEEQEG